MFLKMYAEYITDSNTDKKGSKALIGIFILFDGRENIAGAFKLYNEAVIIAAGTANIAWNENEHAENVINEIITMSFIVLFFKSNLSVK